MRRLLGSPALYTVGGLHVLALALTALGVIARADSGLGPSTGPTVAAAATAYALGCRHAFDPDHIAAIDNTTNHLLAQRREAGGVGLWFSLGHSTVVVVLCVALGTGLQAVRDSVADPDSALHKAAQLIGPLVSATFILTLAVINLRSLIKRRPRNDPSHHHGPSGPVSIILAKMGAIIERPSRMFLVGLLFGLGFDTATEIGLLSLAGSASTLTHWWTALALPLLFAAGMSLLDSAQGTMALRAYDWKHKVEGGISQYRYDLLTAGMSITVAGAIAVVQLASVADGVLPGRTSIAAIIGLDLSGLGWALTMGIFCLWAIAAVLITRRPVLPSDRRGRSPD